MLGTRHFSNKCDSERARAEEGPKLKGILADNDIEGIFTAIVRIWLSAAWHDLWIGLDVQLETFDSLGLPRDASDVLVWQACQEREIILITGNRNAESPESLD